MALFITVMPMMALGAVTTLYTNNQLQQVAVDFVSKPNYWANDMPAVQFTTGYSGTVTGTVTIDADIYIDSNATLGTGFYMQMQGAISDPWAQCADSAMPNLNASSFSLDAATGMQKYHLTMPIAATNNSLKYIFLRFVGADFTGNIYVNNFVVTGEAPAPPPVLPYKDPTIISDFATSADGWVGEPGYDYSNGQVSTAKTEMPTIAYDAIGQRLAVTLDYSMDSASGWSEAKVHKDLGTGIDVSAYNVLSFDMYYPKTFTGFAVKAFSNGIIDSNVSLDPSQAVSVDSTYNKITMQFKFSPSANPMTALTLGIVGKNSNFKGTVYLDNVTLSQLDTTTDFVNITSVANKPGTVANISAMPTTVKLVDENAIAQTRALYSYLDSLIANNQVLFGHQNDTFKSVRTGISSDTQDITGSLSGIVGIDSLSLTGGELGLTDAAAALNTSAQYCIDAASKGAIITLSSHMPNFTNSKIKKLADGTYDFTACNFLESKDLTGNCADVILPGGAYNDVYKAYLDIIANFALKLQNQNIPILFRPFHENNGGWFWWGSAATSVESYKAIYRYMVDYLKSKGVHNLLYIYSPNGPFSSADQYLERYPGDEYIDILALDYYNDYNTYPAQYNAAWLNDLNASCSIVSGIAQSRGKVAALSETGVRVMKANGSDNEGLLIKGNPILGQEWYTKVENVAIANKMPYYLVWANFGDTNFYVPYKYNDTKGQELVNEFIDFYNDPNSIFADGTNFYGTASIKPVTATGYTNPSGYMIAPKDYSVIKVPVTLVGSVTNAANVVFEIKRSDTDTNPVVLPATKGSDGLYRADVTADVLAQIGKTDVAVVTLKGDSTSISSSRFISFNKDKDTMPADIIESFEYYYGNNDLLASTYGTPNSAAGCTSSLKLSTSEKSEGTYGGQFNYTLTYAGSEVWTGLGKALDVNDFTNYNGFSMWVKPDGMGQKFVVQFTANGEEFEVYLSDFVKTTDAKLITIPFSSFKGKKGGTFDGSNVTKFAIWCNSIPENMGDTKQVNSSIYFDNVKAVNISAADLAKVDSNGLIITDLVVSTSSPTLVIVPPSAAPVTVTDPFVHVNGTSGNTTTTAVINTTSKVKTTKNAIINVKDSTINVGDSFDLMKNVTAIDNNGKGKDITNKVSVAGQINTAVAGKYSVTYKVTGSNGKAVSKTVTVTVVTPAPTIALPQKCDPNVSGSP